MTLQERILEALGERALTPRALYEHLSNDMPAAVDCALGALMRSGKVTRELGFYQRISPGGKPAKSNGVAPVASHAAAPLQSNLTVPSAAVSTTSMRTMGAVGPAQVPVAAPTSVLTAREQEIAELAAAGKTNREIAQLLRLKLGTVEVYRHNIRKKTGGAKLERRAETQPTPKSPAAPSAAPPLTAAPSREGAGVATVGAASSNEGAKREVRPPRRFSPDLKARLIQVQQAKAEELQRLLKLADAARQELRDVEEMVRIVSEEGAA